MGFAATTNSNTRVRNEENKTKSSNLDKERKSYASCSHGRDYSISWSRPHQFMVTTKDQNISKYGYIGNWILQIYRKYR